MLFINERIKWDLLNIALIRLEVVSGLMVKDFNSLVMSKLIHKLTAS